MPLQVFDLEFDEWNEGEMARHHVTEREVRQVLDNDPVFLRNKKTHPAPIVMIGPTYGGRMLTVPWARQPSPVLGDRQLGGMLLMTSACGTARQEARSLLPMYEKPTKGKV